VVPARARQGELLGLLHRLAPEAGERRHPGVPARDRREPVPRGRAPHVRVQTANVLLEVRRAAAKYMGANADDIALTPNTTTGLALAYPGLPPAAGDEILVTEHDHYSHHEAVRTAAARAGATWRRVALYEDASEVTTDDVVARIEHAIKPETRVLGVTW